jgi:hypothetical protein
MTERDNEIDDQNPRDHREGSGRGLNGDPFTITRGGDGRTRIIRGTIEGDDSPITRTVLGVNPGFECREVLEHLPTIHYTVPTEDSRGTSYIWPDEHRVIYHHQSILLTRVGDSGDNSRSR